MKADKKVKIKVISNTERRIMEEPEVEMITSWNFKRIIVALLILISLIIIPSYYLSHLNENKVDVALSGQTSTPVIRNQLPKENGQVDLSKTVPKQTIILLLIFCCTIVAIKRSKSISKSCFYVI